MLSKYLLNLLKSGSLLRRKTKRKFVKRKKKHNDEDEKRMSSSMNLAVIQELHLFLSFLG